MDETNLTFNEGKMQVHRYVQTFNGEYKPRKQRISIIKFPKSTLMLCWMALC